MVRVLDVLDNVDRADSLGREEFYARYVSRHIPVIIGNTQRGRPIGDLVTEGGVVAQIGGMAIQVQQNYTSSLARSAADVRRNGISRKVRNQIVQMPLRDYAEHVRENPGTELLCVEYRTPSEMLNILTVPEHCSAPWSDEPLVSFIFIANKGNYAHLHFDGDFRNVLLYQVYGRKRVVMVPVAARDKVLPSMNFSNLLIQNMTESEKGHLFRFLGAYETILEPGEAIYFPPSIWHYVEYLDNGMSINFRFGREEFAQQAVDANRVPFYPDLHLMLARLSQVRDADTRARLQESAWKKMADVLTADYGDSAERHRAVENLYRDLADSMPGGDVMPVQIAADPAITETMAVERYDSASKLWREELMLGAPL